MYCCARACLNWRMQPPARTAMRTFFPPVVKAKGSAEKRWVHSLNGGQSPKSLRKPPRRWLLAQWS
jgi:hypothetical protein